MGPSQKQTWDATSHRIASFISKRDAHLQNHIRCTQSLFLPHLSRLVVGSSRAKTPQSWQKVSARAKRMIKEARTFWPAEQRPRMSNGRPFFNITTLARKATTLLNYYLEIAALPHHHQSLVSQIINHYPPLSITAPAHPHLEPAHPHYCPRLPTCVLVILNEET